MPEFVPPPATWALGGVLLDYTPLSWPFYRGTTWRPVRFQQGAQRRAELDAIPRETTLTINDPFSGVLSIPCVLVSIDAVGVSGLMVTIADRRWHLDRAYMPHDVNLRYGTENIVASTGVVTITQRYVVESAERSASAEAGATPSSVAQALERFCGIVRKEFEGEVLPTAFEIAPSAAEAAAVAVADNTFVAGMTVAQALDAILRPANLDVVVTPIGTMRIVSRTPTAEEDGALAALDWVENRPAWETAGKRLDAPATVVVPYIMRKQYRADYVSPGTTYAPPKRPHFRLYQRYTSIYGSGWVDLDGLLAEVNGANNLTGGFTLTDSAIAGALYTGGWQGTVLNLTAQAAPMIVGIGESARVGIARRLVTVIDTSWRRHFRMEVQTGSLDQVPQNTESDAYFADVRFGTLVGESESDADESAVIGTVRPQAVRGPWVEMYRVPVGPEGKATKADALALKYSQNSGGADVEAPFNARWIDRPARIVEIAPELNRLVVDRRLGALTAQDGLADVSGVPAIRAALTGASNYIGTLYVRRRDITSMEGARIEYATSLEFDVSVVAKTRAPLSDRDRFREIETPSGIEGGQGTVYLPVDPAATCNIDPSDTDERAVLNDTAINAHAKKRVESYLAQYRNGKAGTHTAHGCGPANAVAVDGGIREVTVECGTRGLATVLTRIDRGF